MAGKPNRLAAEQSPYLRQHALNPVDWYPWSEEAFARARRENRPILLSIGYSACHWCHVMERESFESDAIAALMNEGFVNIKVDREERPDVDAIYMNVVQLLTGSGGWPLTVFLDPQGRPFYGGTYFPPEDRYGRPGLPRVLRAVLHAYREKRDDLSHTSEQIIEGLAKLSHFSANGADLARATVTKAAERLFAAHDRTNGGFGDAPKFPNVPAFNLLLRHHYETGRADVLAAFELTLTRMAQGGMYDQLGAGFHRYSVDAHWLVPHFEKMLYDNAQLARLYLDGHVATGNPLYRRIASETLDYLRREMTHPEGAFYSSQDADAGGEEGLTYLWTKQEIEDLLDAEHARILTRYYQVDEAGHFAEPGQTLRKCVLHVKLSLEDMAKLFRSSPQEIERILAEGRATLLAARNRRPQPGRDEKILTSWNALAIRAFVRGACVLGDPELLSAARRAAEFIDVQLRGDDGRLRRTFKDGVARFPGYLDDHAFLAAALLDLFEATGDSRFLSRARALADLLLRDFLDPEAGGFFFTAHDHERLIDRPKIAFDSSIPAGNAVAAETLFRLAHLLDHDEYADVARRTLALFGGLLEQQPFGVAYLMGVLDDHLRGPRDVVVVGPRGAPETATLVRAAHGVYAPAQAVFVVDPSDPEAFVPASAQGKTPSTGTAAAYVCQSFTCSPPASDPGALRALLRRRPPEPGQP